MQLLKQLKTRQQELIKEVAALERFLESVPDGKLITRKISDKYYYSKKIYEMNPNRAIANNKKSNTTNNNQNSVAKHTRYNEVYLPKGSKETFLLAKGEYAKRRLKDAKSELFAVNNHLKILEKEPDAKHFLVTHPGINELVSPSLKNNNEELEKWRTEKYYQNPYHPEMLKYPTVIPEIKVRSKSEADILARLVHFGVPFHYEEGFDTGHGWKFPDFSLRAISPPYEKFYWEHLGGMDSFKYFSENMKKLNELYLCGIVPWKNLIITTETAKEPLDINWVDEIIKYYLL